MNEPILKPVELDEPLTRGDQTITTITVRKPNSGELRGLSLVDIMQMDVIAMGRLLPRVTQPTLTEPEVRQLAPADLMQIGATVCSFLVPKRLQEFPDE
ncbi:phage tail assembly protein [Celerinatantimonas sp. YJH-8]|uniref:phage tail assembly protein n=1 Tax=Celerinatantimonas sp. YJH-8 TaxID=3228714 RepID=UPI0038C2F5F5